MKDWLTTTTAAVKNIWTRPWEFCQLEVCLRFICHIIPLLSVCLCSERHPLLVTSIHWLTRGDEEEGGRGAKVKDFLKTSSAPLYNLDKLFTIWSGAPTKIKLKQAYVKINRCKAFKVQALSSKTFKWEEKHRKYILSGKHFKYRFQGQKSNILKAQLSSTTSKPQQMMWICQIW